MSYKAGSAYVTINPDFRGFHEKIGAELKASDDDFAKAGDRAGAKFMEGFKDRIKAGALDAPKATIRATADTTEAKRKLDDAAKTRTAKIKLQTEWLKSPATLAGLGALALGPQALGLAAGAVGTGLGYASAAADIGAFAAVAVPMFKKVTAAQTALTTARKQYDKATTAAQRATALKAEAAATDGLTTSEKRLGVQLTGLQGAWAKLQTRLQPQVASALVPWFAVARQDMTYLTPLVTDASGAIHDLGAEAKTALAAPFWKTFFADVGQTGGIALRGFGDAIGKVGSGLAHLFVTFKPDIDLIPGFADKAAGAFDRWAASVKRNGLDSFLSKTFSKSNLATLKTDGAALATTLGNVARATEQLSPAAFLGLSKVLELISKLSPAQIETLGGLYAVGKLTGSGGGLGSILGSVLGGTLGKGAAGAAGSGEAAAGAGILARLAGGLPAAAVTAVLVGLSKIHNANGTSWLSQGPGGAKGFLNNYGTFTHDLGLEVSFGALGTRAGDQFFAGMIGALRKPATGGIFNAVIDQARKATGQVGGIFGQIPVSAKYAVQSGLSAAGNWLRPAGVATATGYAAGYKSKNAEVINVVSAGTRGVVQRGTAGAGGWLQPAGAKAAGGFAGAFTAAQGKIAAAVAQVKGTVQHASLGWSSLLAPAGSSLMGGFLGAIQAGEPSVQRNLQNLTYQITQWKGPPAKDAVLLTPAGQVIMASLLKGLQAGFTRVKAWTTGTASQIAGLFGTAEGRVKAGVKDKKISTADGTALTKWLAADSAKLQVVARQRQKILNTIAAADAYAKNVTSTTEANYGILGAASAATPNGGTASASDIIGQLRGDVSKIRQFTKDIVTLRKLGLNRNYLNELIQAGPDAAGAIAHELATGPLKDIRQVNTQESQIVAASRKLGAQSANVMYEAAGQAGKGFLAGLEKQKAAINRLMRSIADEMVAELKKRLGINSPARATIPVGESTGDGVIVGLGNRLARIRAKAAQMAQAAIPRPALALPGVGSSLAASAFTMTVTYAGPSNGAIGAIVKDLRYEIQQKSGGDAQRHLGQGKVRT